MDTSARPAAGDALGPSLAAQVGPDVVPFLRALIAGAHDLTLDEVLDVLENPDAAEPEFRRFVLERSRATAPSREECEGEERASR